MKFEVLEGLYPDSRKAGTNNFDLTPFSLGLAKNTAQLHTLFALSNLWMVRRTLLQEMRG